MKKLIIISAFLMMMPFIGKSQLSIDSLATYQNFTQDTVPYGTLVNFNVKVLYGSTIPFTGTIYLISGVDSTAGVLSQDTVGFLNVLNLINDTVSIPFNDTASNPNGYRVGGDIIVIWPIAAGLVPLDTFKTDIYVLPPLPLTLQGDKDLIDKFSVYPNPMGRELVVKNLSDKVNIKNVKIIDMNGNLIYDQFYQEKINVSNLIKGNYLLEIDLENNQKLIYKLIKTN